MLRYEGDGEFKPAAPYWARQADRDFVVGMTYRLVEHQERSMASHRHYFSALNEIWQSLPDELAALYPTVEHMRKALLIRESYADERSIVCSTKAEAVRIAAFVKPMDEYAIVVVREAVVKVYTAQSQSTKAMGAKVFQESKERVLEAARALLERKAA